MWNWEKDVWSQMPLRVSTFWLRRGKSAQPGHCYTLHSDSAVAGMGLTRCCQTGSPPSCLTPPIPGASGTPYLGPTMGVVFGVPPIPRLSALEDIVPDLQQVRSDVGNSYTFVDVSNLPPRFNHNGLDLICLMMSIKMVFTTVEIVPLWRITRIVALCQLVKKNLS